jgi:hypothetical protein
MATKLIELSDGLLVEMKADEGAVQQSGRQPLPRKKDGLRHRGMQSAEALSVGYSLFPA